MPDLATADLEEVIIPLENSGAAILLIVGGDDQGYGPAYHEVTARGSLLAVEVSSGGSWGLGH